MKRSQPRRDWSDANEKRGPCRVCGETYGVELAHLSGRQYDPPHPYPHRVDFDLYVRPDSVIPLCGPATDTTTCHGMQHAGVLDLLPYLTRKEEACAVLDLGLQRAYFKLGAISRVGQTLDASPLFGEGR